MSAKDHRAPAARTVLQQCLHARLQVKPAGEHGEAEFVQVKECDVPLGILAASFKVK